MSIHFNDSSATSSKSHNLLNESKQNEEKKASNSKSITEIKYTQIVELRREKEID